MAYMKIFARVGLGDITYRTIAAGGSFTTNMTDEFQTLSKSGEDIIYVDKSKKIAINKGVYTPENLERFGLDKSNLIEEKSIEVGNIFPYQSKYPDIFNLKFKDENGLEQPIFMGAYGIGLGRLMGTVVEILSDDKGIIWPKEVAPFTVHLVRLGVDEKVVSFADELYADLRKNGIEVLYDDRDLRPGEKFADSDLIGIPVRFVVSDKTVSENKIEVKYRTSPDSELMSREEALKIFS